MSLLLTPGLRCAAGDRMMLSACDRLTHLAGGDWRSRGEYESSRAWLRCRRLILSATPRKTP